MKSTTGGSAVKFISALMFILILASSGIAKLKSPKIAINLPEKYNTPDGMYLDMQGNIILSMPNFNNDKYPAKILQIDKNDQVTELVSDLPLHPETGKCGVLGITVGTDGCIYYADNQAFGTEEHKSRLMRVVMVLGKPYKVECLVEGFVMSNAVSCYGDKIYVTETKLDPAARPLPSGVYVFSISEFDSGVPIKLLPGGQDRHLLTTIYTYNEEWPVGANGMGFDNHGNLLVCNFGDAQILRYKLDPNGWVIYGEVLAEKDGMQSADGMKVDPVTGDIYVADFVGNAVHKVDSKTGKVTTLAQNGNTDGSGGKLDKPSEVCRRGNKLYISNIDLTLADNKYDKPHTISVIELDD